MKKKWLIFNFITLMLFCQPIIGVSAVTDTQKKAISENCLSIKESLKTTQRMDAKTRVYFGGLFEGILTRFITPLNVKLLESNMSNIELIDNQTNFAEAKQRFSSDYVKYQQALEELVSTDCKAEPGTFYNRLEVVREKRKVMSKDIAKLKNLILENVRLVTSLGGSL